MMQFINKYKFFKKIVYSTVHEMAVDALDAGAFLDSSLDDKDFADFYSVARSDYLQEIYNERHLKNFIIFPKQIPISNNNTTLKYTYAPIRMICEKYLKNNSILQKIIFEQQRRTTTTHPNDKYSSLLDGSVSSKRNIQGALKMELYFDDVELTPANGKGKSRKFLQVYASCVDIPYQKRMHQHEIELLMMIDRKKVHSLNLDDPLSILLAPLTLDLQSLLSEGIEVETNGQQYKIPVVITSILGDNLAIYELLGKTCSFNANSFVCRFCHAQGNSNRNATENIQNLSIGMNLLSGNENDDILSLGQHPRHTFPFTDLTGVHQWNIAPPDLMHDVSEGAMPLILEIMLTSIVEKSKAKIPSYNWGRTKKESIDFIISSFKSNIIIFYEDSLELSWIDKQFKLQGKSTMVSIIKKLQLYNMLYKFYFYRKKKCS